MNTRRVMPGVIVTLSCLFALCLGQAGRKPQPGATTKVPFAPSTPAALRNFWLDFHGNRLCQDIDAVFVFHERGLEIWCLTENPNQT